MGIHLRAMERQLLYGITQVLSANRQVNAPRHNPSQNTPVLDLPTPEEWKAEFS